MRIDLAHPVELNGTTYQAVTLRRAKARDMVKIADHMPALMALAGDEEPAVADGTGAAEGAEPAAAKPKAEIDFSAFNGSVVEAMIGLVSVLTDTPKEVVEEFDFDDLAEIAGKATDFLSSSKSLGGG